MTAVAPCPYLSGMTERKVFANLPFSNGAHVNDELTHAGFRRSQNIAYRPACEGCDACVSVRLPVEAWFQSDVITRPTPAGKKIKELRIDPDAMLPDALRNDNLWSEGG